MSPVRQPALLGGGHDQRLAVLPAPGAQWLPMEAVGGARQVAAVVLGPHGEEEGVAEARDARLQQAAPDRQLVVRSLLGHAQLDAVERAAHRAHVRGGCAPGDRRSAARSRRRPAPRPVVEGHPLRAVAGVHRGGSGLVPRHPLAPAPAAGRRVQDRVDDVAFPVGHRQHVVA